MKRRTDEILNSETLLDVDLEAQIRKLVERSNRAPEHYLVEMVRDAVRRKANRIEIKVGKKTAEIRDDGRGISKESLQALMHVFNPGHSMDVRAKALGHFEGIRGLGLLSAFGPAPDKVTIASSDVGRGIEVTFRGRKLLAYRKENFSWQGTRIRLHRGGNPKREEEAVREHCRFLGARIVLNRETLPESYVDVPVLHWKDVREITDFGALYGHIWLPAKSSVSRIWLLDHGVVWKQATIPWQTSGIVFEAALEMPTRQPGLVRHVRRMALQLLDELLEQWDSLASWQQNALELNVFRLVETHQKWELLERLPGFPDVRGEHHSLQRLNQVAQSAPIFWVERRDFGAHGDELTLVLTEQQVDFLGRQIPQLTRAPGSLDPGTTWSKLLQTPGQWLERLVPTGGFVSDSALEPEELHALRVLEDALNSNNLELPSDWPPGIPTVTFSNASSWTQCRVLKARRQWILIVFRRNRQVRRAIHLFARRKIGPALLVSAFTGGALTPTDDR